MSRSDPEKREFFQEGSGVHEIGISTGGAGTLLKLFHGCQIGLSRGQPVPIVVGGRITGRIAGLTLGLLDVQTEPVGRPGVPASNYGVMCVKRDVLARSSVGGFFINRKTGTADFNRVFGADANSFSTSI